MRHTHLVITKNQSISQKYLIGIKTYYNHMREEFEFDVALSFAGGQREYVKKVAACLHYNGIRVFFDEYEDLWGEDMYLHFDDIFQNKARFAVVFGSKEYAQKLWPSHELKSIFARAISQNEAYMLPVRFDDTVIPGIRPTIKYEDARKISPEELCQKILKKLNKESLTEDISHDNSDEIELPTIKRKITDFEKDKFLNKSFQEIKDYFYKALKTLEGKETGVNTSLDKITKTKFISKVYVNGEIKSICKIWLGSGITSGSSVSYSEGSRHFDFENDSSINDYANVEDDGKEIFFRISGIGSGRYSDGINIEKASAKELAAYLWKRFINNIN